MPRVFITGASGFVGKYLCDWLSERNHEVHGLVRRAPSTGPTKYVIGDIASTAQDLYELIPSDIDVVVHLAGRAHILSDVADDPLSEFRRVNRDATLSLASACLRRGVKRFVYVSSIGVHGNFTCNSTFRSDSPYAPSADYAVSKAEAERELEAFLLEKPMELVIVRPPLVYAADARGNFQKLLKLVYSKCPLPFHQLSNCRSMIYVKNLTSFLEQCVLKPEAAGKRFTISDSSGHSTEEIVSLLSQGMGFRPYLFKIPKKLVWHFLRLLGRQSLYHQLFGDLVVNSDFSCHTLNWVPPFDSRQALIDVGRDYSMGRQVDN